MTPNLSQAFLAQRSRTWLTLPGRGRYAAKFLSNITDQYFINRYAEEGFAGTSDMCLVAVGGYGRREMALKSDIDVLIMCRELHEESGHKMASALFHPLWDAGLEVGHGVRDVSRCLELAANDFKVLTSLMDIRYVCGDQEFFEDFAEQVKNLIERNKKELIEFFARTRGTEFDSTEPENFLEPDLKNGPGGIRDIHLIFWLEKLMTDGRRSGHEEWRQDLADLQSYFFDLRNVLHSMGRRKNDTLYLDIQPEAASIMGYKGVSSSSAVEIFLGDLFRNQNRVSAMAMSALEKAALSIQKNVHKGSPSDCPDSGIYVWQERIFFHDSADLHSDYYLAVRAFRFMSSTGFCLSWEARQQLQRASEKQVWRDRVRDGLLKAFSEIISGKNPGQCLRGMHQAGLMGIILPELERRWFLVQFDGVHTYPLGEHSLRCLDLITGFDRDKDFLGDHLQEFKDSLALRMAAIMHDMGKGGKNHESVGAEMAGDLLRLFGLDEEDAQDVIFLIKNHLLMVKTALKRDLDEEGVVARFASQVGSLRRLKLLCFLSYADSRATGPRVWTQWQESLIARLFFAARKLMKSTILCGHHAGHRMAAVRDRIRSSPLYSHSWEQVMEVMPYRYLLKVPTEKIIRHIKLSQSLNRKNQKDASGCAERDFILLTEKGFQSGAGPWDLTLVARDRKGLMARIAAALAMNQIEIYSASFFTWEDGTVVDLFKVSPPVDMLYAGSTWQGVRTDLQKLIANEKDSQSFCATARRKNIPGSRLRISVNSSASDFYTIIEVRSPGHPCLTWHLCTCLAENNLDISHALISTHMDQTSHVFYVRGAQGAKLGNNSKTLIRKILSTIKSII